jgi:hypothetical protein
MMAKIKTNHEELMAIMKATHDETEAKKAYQEATEACLEKAEATIKASQERMRAKIKTGLKEKKATVLEVNQGKTKATAEPYKWALSIKATYVLTAPKCRSSIVPHAATLEKR